MGAVSTAAGVLAQQQGIQQPLIDYPAMAPVLVVLGAACVSVLVEAFLPRHQRWPVQVGLSLFSLVVAGAALALYARDAGSPGITTLADTVAIDGPTLFLWGTLLALGIAAILLIADRSIEPGGAFVAESAAEVEAEHGGAMTRAAASVAGMRTEVFPLALFSLGGMMVV